MIHHEAGLRMIEGWQSLRLRVNTRVRTGVCGRANLQLSREIPQTVVNDVRRRGEGVVVLRAVLEEALERAHVRHFGHFAHSAVFRVDQRHLALERLGFRQVLRLNSVTC